MDNRIRAPFFSEKKRANHHVRDYDLFNQKCLLRQGGRPQYFFDSSIKIGTSQKAQFNMV